MCFSFTSSHLFSKSQYRFFHMVDSSFHSEHLHHRDTLARTQTHTHRRKNTFTEIYKSPKDGLSAGSRRGHSLLFYCIDIRIDPSFLPLSLILLTPSVVIHPTAGLSRLSTQQPTRWQRESNKMFYLIFECSEHHVLIETGCSWSYVQKLARKKTCSSVESYITL